MDKSVVDQITDVASATDIQKYALTLPDAHTCHGFPIDGVAAMNMKERIISLRDVNFDIHCFIGDKKSFQV